MAYVVIILIIFKCSRKFDIPLFYKIKFKEFFQVHSFGLKNINEVVSKYYITDKHSGVIILNFYKSVYIKQIDFNMLKLFLLLFLN